MRGRSYSLTVAGTRERAFCSGVPGLGDGVRHRQEWGRCSRSIVVAQRGRCRSRVPIRLIRQGQLIWSEIVHAW
jgi:hypothetical protein